MVVIWRVEIDCFFWLWETGQETVVLNCSKINLGWIFRRTFPL